MHHLISDHTSMEILFDEVGAHLSERFAQLPAPLPFRSFVAQARLGISREEHEAFFRQMLADVDEPTAPFGLLDVQSDGSNVLQAERPIDLSLARRLRVCARELGISVATLYHLAWARVLAAISGRDDVVFGTVLFGRMQGGEGADRVLGLFINTLPIRIPTGDLGVAQSATQTHALLAQLLRHEHASLALAQRCSAIPAPTPLFSALLNYRYAESHRAHTDQTHSWEGIEALSSEERTNYPLTLSVDDFGDEGFALTAQVHASIDPHRICDFMQTALEQLTDALESAPATPVCHLGVLPSAEAHRLLVEWNATDTPYPADCCVHEFVEVQVAATPDAVAVVYEDTQLTYAQLNVQANQLAQYLRSIGVAPDTRVAICASSAVWR